MGTLIKPIFLVSIMFIMASCTSDFRRVRLTALGTSVKISKRLPPGFCREIGEVYASHGGPGDALEEILENARNNLRNKAARQGANYAMVETTNTTIQATQTVIVLVASTFNCRPSKKFLRRNRKKVKSATPPLEENQSTDGAVLDALEEELRE